LQPLLVYFHTTYQLIFHAIYQVVGKDITGDYISLSIIKQAPRWSRS